MDEEFEFEFEPEDSEAPTKEELAIWLSEFMNSAVEAEHMYRSHFCDLVANRVYAEFGHEGLCELMISIDKRAGWISDIIIENNDIDDILFKKFGTYDNDSIRKARASKAMTEMNQKMWRLRRKYARIIADELMGAGETETPTK